MKIRRVVVRLDPTPRSRAVLDPAAILAEKLEAEFVGLFVENIDLLHLAGFPFAHEVGFPSATRRPLDLAAMERSLHAHAKQAQELLARAAGRSAARWSFRFARVAAATEPSTLLAEADLVVAHLAHMDELSRNADVRVVRAGDADALRAGLERTDGGILVLAGNDDALMGETLRKLHEAVGP